MIKNGQVTIKDLARKLDVSVSTVSRALRNLPDVNPATKKLVQELAEALNYEPNAIATSLVTKKTKTVGVIIPGFIIHFYASAISGIQNTLSEAGYNVMICQSSEDFDTEVSNIHMLLSSRVDGIIASISRETMDFSHFEIVKKKKTPLILFNRVTNSIDAPKVMVDDYQGAVDAVEHLIANGCRRIAHIAGPKSLHLCRNRRKGYQDTLMKHGLEVDESLIKYCDFTMESGEKCCNQLLSLPDPPDAVFVVCDAAAFGAMKAIKEKKLNIPEEIAMVGYTNEPLAALVEPSLTTVSQPTYAIGQTAAQLFLDQIYKEPEERQIETRILKTELVIRNSSLKKGEKEMAHSMLL